MCYFQTTGDIHLPKLIYTRAKVISVFFINQSILCNYILSAKGNSVYFSGGMPDIDTYRITEMTYLDSQEKYLQLKKSFILGSEEH